MNTRRGLYKSLIIEATGVSEKDSRYLDYIMCKEVFHSTLDWQTRAKFVRGARQAVKILKAYRADPELARYFPA